jgi:N-acetylglucosamine-6-sulfatase
MCRNAHGACTRPRRVIACLVLSGALLVGLCVAHIGSASARRQHGTPPAALASSMGAGPSVAAKRPNIVFVLTDDLSMDLLRYMPQVQALQRRGLTFRNYFVSDSLCCPSRASIFTGEFPHDTHVLTNTPPTGGFDAFHVHGDEGHSFNVALQRAGYQTAMMGKYLNGYLYEPGVPMSYVPPGWNTWDVAGWGYPEYDYKLNDNGTIRTFGHSPRDYLTDVLTRYGVGFIDRAASSGKPFFLELATFAPHTPYTPAPRYAHAFRGLRAPRPRSFDVLPSLAPRWLADHPRLTRSQIAHINDVFRKRVQAVQSVNDMLARIRSALVAHRLLNDTDIVFSSDNGLHTGEYRLMPGKLTAFDTDIHVPLVIAGPGIPHHSSTNAMAENVDLAETFAQLGGTSLAGDGHSLVALLQGGRPQGWRDAALVEHDGEATGPGNPDAQSTITGNPPSYEAIRTPRFLYVEYRNGQHELYDLRADPFELDNIITRATQAARTRLHEALSALRNCHTASRCWAAAHIAGLGLNFRHSRIRRRRR